MNIIDIKQPILQNIDMHVISLVTIRFWHAFSNSGTRSGNGTLAPVTYDLEKCAILSFLNFRRQWKLGTWQPRQMFWYNDDSS